MHIQEILMYNPANQAQLFIGAQQSQSIEKLEAEGWVKSPRLIAMYQPEFKKHVMVRIGEEQRAFENRGYYAEPTIIYHPKDGERTVSAEEAKKALKNGWYNSPAHLPGNKEAA